VGEEREYERERKKTGQAHFLTLQLLTPSDASGHTTCDKTCDKV